MTVEAANARPPRPVSPPFVGLPEMPAIRTLQARHQWLAWGYEWKENPDLPDGGKWDKPPRNPRTGANASVTNPATWGTFEDAAARVRGSRDLDGVGFALSADDGLTGIDLDKCRNPETGALAPWAAEVLALAETYAEISPSGRGVRLFALGKEPASFKCDPAGVEVYPSARYLTVTGQHIDASPVEILPAPKTLALVKARVEAIRAEMEAAKRAERTEGPPNGHAANGAGFGKAGPDWSGGDFFSSVNSLALERLSAWVEELFGSDAQFQPGTQGYRVTSRSLGRGLEEDLSITPQGIKDFGVHDMGDPRDGGRSAVDVVMEHGGAADPAAAALWLGGRLRVDPASLGWRGSGRGEERTPSGQAGGAKPSAAPGECLPLFPSLPPAEPYPVEALSALRAAAKAIAAKVQVPAALASQSVLAAASLAVQAHADVVLPYGQKRPTSVYCATVAASGERKTSSDSEACWPVHRREKSLAEDREEELKTYRIDKAAWEAERRRIENDKKLDFEGRREALRFLGDEPEPPLYAFLTAADPTIEGLAKAWPNAHPALGIFAGEGGMFTGGHAMSDDSRLRSAAALSAMWDGAPIKRARALDGVSILRGRRLAMHLMLQPDVAAEFLSHPVLRDQGLLSRVLVAAPESLAGSRMYREATAEEDAAIRAYGARLLAILEARPAMAEGKRNELEPRALPLSAEATRAWIAFHDHVERQVGPDGALRPVRDLGAKAAEHAARIAGVLTLYGDLRAEEVGQAAMADACELVDWYLREAIRLQAAGRTDPKLLQAQRLLDWMRANAETSGTVAFADLIKSGPGPLRTKEALEVALAILKAHGWIAADGGRPRVVRLALATEAEEGRA